jgi:hypothetical protein
MARAEWERQYIDWAEIDEETAPEEETVTFLK